MKVFNNGKLNWVVVFTFSFILTTAFTFMWNNNTHEHNVSAHSSSNGILVD